MEFRKVQFWVRYCFHSIQHHLVKLFASTRILNSIFMRMILSYTSISPTRMLLRLSPSLMPAFMMPKSGCKLKLNPGKTEFIVFGSKAQCQKISSHFPVSILGSLLHPVDSVRNLGVWFDADFSFSEHIKRTCKACFLQMRDLRRIRKYLTPEVAVLAANALVSSRLDYCNSLFRGLSGFNQYKLQSIQNTLARIVTNHGKCAHVTPILQKLYWLPVRYRCIFKTATLVYKFLHSGSPSYFEPFLSFSSCPYSSRHSHPDRQYLTVPPFHSSVFKSAKHFGHSFAFDDLE